jgi:hypothetical protein
MPKKGNKSQGNKQNSMDTDKVKKCLTGLSYPANKEQLIQHAQNTCADQEVVSMLKDLPEQSYGAMTDLTQALGGVLGRGIHLKLDI